VETGGNKINEELVKFFLLKKAKRSSSSGIWAGLAGSPVKTGVPNACSVGKLGLTA